jgi:hypothetical protein
MKVIRRATLKLPKDGPTLRYSLVQIEEKCFRWIDETSGNPTSGIDYLSEHDGVKALRVAIESDPDMVGADLTFLAVAPPPENRAANRIINKWLERLRNLGYDMMQVMGQNEVEDIFREETAIDRLLESVNLLLAYEFPRLRAPKRPGLDMTHAGLMLAVIEALEVAQKQPLDNLKSKLTEGVESVAVYSNIPMKPGGKAN